MNRCINAFLTPRVAASLLISREITFSEPFSSDMCRSIFSELKKMSIQELLQIIDCHHYGLIADVKYIPQFGKISTVIKVPDYFAKHSHICADYAQLGFYLKQDVHASLEANIKFGENHGKTAALLGIINCNKSRFEPSVFTSFFSNLTPEDKEQIIFKLLFRIPIIQILLNQAKDHPFNGYSPMNHLSKSTRQRRAANIKAILNHLKSFNDDDLIRRINNIYWKEDE